MLIAIVTVLAAMDGWAIGLLVASFILNLVQTALWKIVDNRTRRLNDIEKELATRTEQLIDARISARLAIHLADIRELNTKLDFFRERLGDGEDEFEKLSNRDQKLELALKDQREWMLTNFANKKDVELLASQIDGLAAHVRGRKAAV